MLDLQAHVLAGNSVGGQSVRDRHARRSRRPLQKLAHQASCGCSIPIALALDESIGNKAFCADGAGKPMLFPGEGDDNVIETPFVAPLRRTATDFSGNIVAEILGPLSHCFVTYAMPRIASISSTMRKLSGKRE
jgi:hypothetical protein